MVKLIWSNLKNQINLVRYTTKFETLWFDQHFFKKPSLFYFIKLVGWKISNQNLEEKMKKIRKNESTWNIFL